MTNIYFRTKMANILKIIFKTVIVFLIIAIVIWTCIFLTDYILYKNNRQALFTKTKIDNTNDEFLSVANGLGYKFVTKNDETSLYLFGKKIK